MLYSGYVIGEGVSKIGIAELKQAVDRLKKTRVFSGKEYHLWGVGTIDWAHHKVKSFQRARPGSKKDATKTKFLARVVPFGGVAMYGAVYSKTVYSRRK